MKSALSGPTDWILRYIKTYLFLFQYVNPAYERIFGYTRDELVGKEEKSMPELHESTESHLLKGRVGVCHATMKHIHCQTQGLHLSCNYHS